MKSSMSQTASEHLLSENAKLQVHITTLQSQTNSLNAQHTALQLANSQLVAEKEEVPRVLAHTSRNLASSRVGAFISFNIGRNRFVHLQLLKERNAQQHVHTALLRDQSTMQSLHEQLNNEYEILRRERDSLKSNLRDARNENRTLRESVERLETKSEALQSEREAFVTSTRSLNNLRGEHSKLKVCFSCSVCRITSSDFTLTERRRRDPTTERYECFRTTSEICIPRVRD